MRYMILILSLVFSQTLFAEEISLTVEEYDASRNRASILVVDSSQVPLGTILRVHSKTGVCEVKITEQVNDHLIGTTTGCDIGVITPGMQLAYSQPNTWEAPTYDRSPSQEMSTSYNDKSVVQEILERTTVYIGHNFSSQLEGNVYSDGTVKDLDGDTALSFGLKGRVYDFTDRFFLAVELGYETPRTLDQATFVDPITRDEEDRGTIGYSPRLSLWSLAVQGEAALTDGLTGFAGLNLSLPSMNNSPFSSSGDIGFQAGANYQLFPQVALEGLIKITNLNLRNNLGQTTDVSLAGLEVRGRYNF